MGTTFVTITHGPSEKGFWLRDSLLELWLRLAALHISDPTEPGLANTVRDQWLLASRGFFSGWVPHCFEEFASTPEDREILEQATSALGWTLPQLGERLEARCLAMLGCEWGQDVEVWRLQEVNRAIRDLFASKIELDASDTTFMPGCGKRPYSEAEWPCE